MIAGMPHEHQFSITRNRVIIESAERDLLSQRRPGAIDDMDVLHCSLDCVDVKWNHVTNSLPNSREPPGHLVNQGPEYHRDPELPKDVRNEICG